MGEIPTIEDITHCAWPNAILSGESTDFRYNTEDTILMIIETLILQCAEDFKGASFIMTAIPGIWIQKNGLSALNKFR